MKTWFVASSLLGLCLKSGAAPLPPEVPERTLSMDAAVLEDIKVEGLVQAWKLRKVCIDGQAYLLVLGAAQTPVSIAPAFKDGKPQQCQAKAPK
jgi:hypothetical protein